MNTRVRCAVVGCGALARSAHLPNIRESELLELVVACDSRKEAADGARTEFGAARACIDWREVVAAPDVELIVLCTHTSLRGELIVEALRHGKAVYTEKPLANSRREMMEILRASDATGLPVCVGHNRRSSPAVLEFKRLVEKARCQGADRDPSVNRSAEGCKPLAEERQTQLLIRVNDDIRSWKGWIFEDEEGIIFAEMVHFIDLALWLNPTPPVEVYASGSPRGNFTEIIRFQDGSLATLFHSMVGNFDYPKELFEASLRNVTVALDHHVEVRQRGLRDEPFRRSFAVGQDAGGAQGIERFHRQVDAIHVAMDRGEPYGMPSCVDKGHRAHLERFGRHLRGEGENPCPVDSAIVVTNVALKLLESCRLGLPVKVGSEDADLPRR